MWCSPGRQVLVKTKTNQTIKEIPSFLTYGILALVMCPIVSLHKFKSFTITKQIIVPFVIVTSSSTCEFKIFRG